MHKTFTLTLFVAISMLFLSACQPILEPGTAAAPAADLPEGGVHAVMPTGDAALDPANVQTAIDQAEPGDTVLLSAGVFNFGDWRTNPIPGGLVVVNKGITLTGDGFDSRGFPKTVIAGGGYRQKNHWEYGEWAVITFGGDGKGGVVQDLWMRGPHFRGIGINGFADSQNHESFTVRNVKITGVTQDIPGWNRDVSVGRAIAMGWNDPEQGIGGPTGTILVEGCDISNMTTMVDVAYVDPDTDTLYYADSNGVPLEAQTSYGIGMFISTSASFEIRDNRIENQHEGIVAECMAGTGNLTFVGNEITITPGFLSRDVQRGIRLNPCFPAMNATPFARNVLIEDNVITMVAGAEADSVAKGMQLSSDNGVEQYAGRITVRGNRVDMQGGVAALALGAEPDLLVEADIGQNQFLGHADYAILSVDGAQHCTIFENDMEAFTANAADVGLYGPNSRNNIVQDVDDVDIGLGAGQLLPPG